MADLRRTLTPRRLRLVLALLFVALALPIAVLVWQAQHQIKWEAFHQYRNLADELAQRVDVELQRLVAGEEAHAFADYQFLVLTGDPATSSYVQRSPLAQFPVRSEVPGLIGYFQIDASGAFSTPLLPAHGDAASLGIDAAELAARAALQDRLLAVLSENQLVARRRDQREAEGAAAGHDSASRASPETAEASRAPDGSSVIVGDKVAASNAAAAPVSSAASSDVGAAAQAAFDELNAVPAERRENKKNVLGRVADLKLDDLSYEKMEKARSDKDAYADVPQQMKSARIARKEQTAILEAAAAEPDAHRQLAARRVRIFESEVAPFQLALLDSGQFVLYRNVWRDGRRTIQGALIEQTPFLDAALAQPFRATALAGMSDLVIAFQGAVLRVVPGTPERTYLSRRGELQGALLHQVRLSAPLSDVQLIWNIKDLPAGPGGRVVIWTSIVLLAVLVAGFVVLERAGLRQIQLVRQQQDFVSAVSHELKTPLTSIRMYGEMLREGWVVEDKKREYYSFIFDESERLSRLIANVLQLARLERNDLALTLRRTGVQTLVDLLRSKLASQVERAGFTCTWHVDPDCAAREVEVDADAVAQIVINLVDNALKFAAGAARREIELGVRCAGGQVVFSVRDHGPGVPKDQQRKIFRLFYRPGSELTRATPGTGIGLALARQLAQAMRGDVRLTGREPGAEFEVVLPVVA